MPRLRIKKSGIQKNVEDCLPNELIFDSNLNTLKDSYSGLVIKTIVGFSPQTVIFAHNLGYIPNFKVYYDNNDGIFHDGSNAIVDYAGPMYNNSIAYADTSNIYMDFFDGTYRIKYFIFRNPS